MAKILAPRKVKALAAPKKSSSNVKSKAASLGAVKKTLKKTEDADSAFYAGDLAPSFSALNEKSEKIFSKDATPGCAQESCDFRDQFGRVKILSAISFGVSRDSVKSHAKFQEKHEFPFSLLSDEDGKICKNLYGRKYMCIERTTFLIDEKGRIIKVYTKVKVNGHVAQVLEDLK